MSWRHRAACRHEDPELFFPVGNSGPALRQISQAQAVCRRCPVVSDCLSWALRHGQATGVWGGLGEVERDAVGRSMTVHSKNWRTNDEHHQPDQRLVGARRTRHREGTEPSRRAGQPDAGLGAPTR